MTSGCLLRSLQRPLRSPLCILVLAAALVAIPAPANATAASSLALGFAGGLLNAPADRELWLGRAAESGSDIVRIDIGWAAPNTPTRPAGFDARNPADPGYNFTVADAAISAATSHGLRVLASFTGAPRWAEGPGRPAGPRAGSWRPDPAALEEFGAALARRYSGTFPDPARPGRMLPRVDAFQPWNEPNLGIYLSPQWLNGKLFAAAHYRRMLSAFYRGVKSVRGSALVVSAGTAPFGYPVAEGRRLPLEQQRVMPVRFWREMLCLRESKGRLRGTNCPSPARFDVLDHHPYTVGFPRRKALNADDVSIADIGKLTRLLRYAERSGRAPGPKRHRVWATEVSFDSSPPDPGGVPVATHARFLAESFYLLWRQGVDTIAWYQIRDPIHDPKVNYNETVDSGVYFSDGRPKPAEHAFRFPFVADRVSHSALRVWGRSPVAGSVRIERRTTSGWHLVRTIRAGRHGTFLVRIASRKRIGLRARVATETSLPWPST